MLNRNFLKDFLLPSQERNIMNNLEVGKKEEECFYLRPQRDKRLRQWGLRMLRRQGMTPEVIDSL